MEQVFNNNDQDFLEKLAWQAEQTTRQYFGKAISIYAPIYLSNYCDSNCLYCGFNSVQKIERKKLSNTEIEQECLALSQTGIQNVLLLTGESRKETPPEYLVEAVQIVKKYFPNIALEVYPLETTEYIELFNAGVDGVTIYQETYNKELYSQVHLAGQKQNYDYRYQTPERMAQAGIRFISLGVLLGLAPWREDVKQLFMHLDYLINKYPGVEFSLSFPRIQKLTGWDYPHKKIIDSDMVKIIALARILFPRVDISITTRESAQFRDAILPMGITRISAGSSTEVGGYSERERKKKGQAIKQFEINDQRSLTDVKEMLANKGFDPVLTSWRLIS